MLPNANVVDSTDNDLVGPADSARGIAAWSVGASVVRRAAFTQLDPDAGSIAQLGDQLITQGWRGAWSPTSLAVLNGHESSRMVEPVAAAADRLRAAAAGPGALLRRNLPRGMRSAALARTMDTLRGTVALGVLAVLVASLLSGELPFSVEVWQVLIAGVALHGAAGLIRWELSDRRLGPAATVRGAFEEIDASVASLATAVTGRPMTGAGRSLGIAFVATVAVQVALATRALSSVLGWPLADPPRDVEMALLAGALLVSVPLLRAIGVIIPQRLRRGSARVGSQLQVQMGGNELEVLDVGPLGMGVRVA